MGILKQIITQVVVKKIEETVVEKAEERLSAKEERKKAQIKTAFQSREDLAGYASLYFFSSQFIYMLILLVCQIEPMSWTVFCRYYAMAALVSCALFLVGLIALGLHMIDLLPVLTFIPLAAVCFLAFLIAECGFGLLVRFFLGLWMNTTTQIVFFLLGVATVSVSFYLLCRFESAGARKKTKNHPFPIIEDEEAEENRSLLRAAIQESAITVRLLKGQWGFSKNTDVLFGCDTTNKRLVFVSNRSDNIIDYAKVVYFDFEDVAKESDSAVNTREYHRLIKLYYLGASKKEHVVSMAQVYNNDENINRIKHNINTCPAGNSEVVFKRKMRHLAATLDRDFYPCRPFVSDDWFEQLKECMEKIKNNKTDGYSLFKNKVIAAEDYMDDETLFSIICDFSLDPPDKSSAKKEARRLCLHNFGATLGNNIKSSVKNIFSNDE